MSKDGTLTAQDKALTYGAGKLSDIELLETVLGNRSAAEALVSMFGNIVGISLATPKELAGAPGIGKSKAVSLHTAFCLAKRVEAHKLNNANGIRDPEDVAILARSRIDNMEQEHFCAIGLNARQQVILFRVVAVGSLSQVDVHPRELFRPMVRNGVHSVILVHNHPSNDVSPSDADIHLTKRMCEVGTIIGIPVLDHVIVSSGDYSSLAALGLVPQ
jgi:DNA repair protein RadC